jgi:hypothetical protein
LQQQLKIADAAVKVSAGSSAVVSSAASSHRENLVPSKPNNAEVDLLGLGDYQTLLLESTYIFVLFQILLNSHLKFNRCVGVIIYPNMIISAAELYKLGSIESISANTGHVTLYLMCFNHAETCLLVVITCVILFMHVTCMPGFEHKQNDASYHL